MPRAKLPPTIRQRRLGAELRRLREQADLNATQAGHLLGWSQSRVSSIESGAFAVSAEKVRSMARAYMCADGALIDALAGYTGGRSRGWWDEYREILPPAMLDLAELEHHATAITIATVVHMPGLLQTTDHTRALISSSVPSYDPPSVEHRVSYRIKRQGVLYGEQPTPLIAIVHEAALHMHLGGPAVARAQLENLVAMSERENVTVLALPFGSGAIPTSGQGIVLLNGEVPHLSTVQLDLDYGSEFLDTQPQLVKFRTVIDHMKELALKPGASRDLIRRIARDV